MVEDKDDLSWEPPQNSSIFFKGTSALQGNRYLIFNFLLPLSGFCFPWILLDHSQNMCLECIDVFLRIAQCVFSPHIAQFISILLTASLVQYTYVIVVLISWPLFGKKIKLNSDYLIYVSSIGSQVLYLRLLKLVFCKYMISNGCIDTTNLIKTLLDFISGLLVHYEFCQGL